MVPFGRSSATTSYSSTRETRQAPNKQVGKGRLFPGTVKVPHPSTEQNGGGKKTLEKESLELHYWWFLIMQLEPQMGWNMWTYLVIEGFLATLKLAILKSLIKRFSSLVFQSLNTVKMNSLTSGNKIQITNYLISFPKKTVAYSKNCSFKNATVEKDFYQNVQIIPFLEIW